MIGSFISYNNDNKRKEYNAQTTSGSWQKVIEFNGNSTKTTQLFTITSKEWAVGWATDDGGSGVGVFQIYIYNSNGALEGVCANVSGESTDVSYIHNGGGVYYLEINTTQPYAISVQEWR